MLWVGLAHSTGGMFLRHGVSRTFPSSSWCWALTSRSGCQPSPVPNPWCGLGRSRPFCGLWCFICKVSRIRLGQGRQMQVVP